MKRSTIVLILRILIGSTFILSGVAKLDSIYQFEQAIFKAGVTDWSIIPYLSRFTIAFEILLGICFFHYEGLKKFTIPATFVMLVIFCIHLTYTIITEGGTTGNCGCFGDKIPMTPLNSLIKNIITLGALAYLYKVPIEKPAREFFIPVSLGALSFIFVFFFFPIKEYIVASPVKESSEVKNDSSLLATKVTQEKTDSVIDIEKSGITKVVKNTNEDKGQKKDPVATNDPVVKNSPAEEKKAEAPKPPRVTSRYAPFKTFSNGVTTDLDEGKKIVTMYNTGCDHCMENAKKLVELNRKGLLPPVYVLFWGNEEEIPAFFEFAKGNFPYKLLEPQVFIPLLGKGNFPRVTYLYEGNIMGEWEGDDFTSEKLTQALKK